MLTPEQAREIADAYRTGSRVVTEAEVADLDAYEAARSAALPVRPAPRTIFDLPVAGWAWREDAREVEA